MKQKRIISLFLSILILFSFSACSNSDSAETDFNKTTTESISVSEQEAIKSDNKDVTENTTNKSNEKETTVKATESSQSITQDKYKTDPIPEGKPKPVEPQEQKTTKKTAVKTTNKAGNTTTKQNTTTKKVSTCTIYIECSTVFNNMDKLDKDLLDIIPKNGIVLSKRTVTFYEGESVLDLLQRVCKENKIHMEASFTTIYNSAYVEGINNLYELDCGSASGWMFSVNGWFPNYGCSRYQLKQGDVVEWRYTCNYGKDIGKTMN